MRYLWHRFVLRHKVTRLGKIAPDYITRGGIAVYEQDSFRPPMKHYECSCGSWWKIWL
jgi:hypothetical protein